MSSFHRGPDVKMFIPIIIFAAFFVCYVALYCFCKKRRRQIHQNVTRIVYTPTPLNQPHPSGYQPSYPACQPVPVPLHMHGGPPSIIAPPPSYLEATNMALSPHHPGPPMFLHPSHPSVHPDVHAQPPYNPAFCPDTYSYSPPFQ